MKRPRLGTSARMGKTQGDLRSTDAMKDDRRLGEEKWRETAGAALPKDPALFYIIFVGLVGIRGLNGVSSKSINSTLRGERRLHRFSSPL